jgi:hypothetical protein
VQREPANACRIVACRAVVGQPRHGLFEREHEALSTGAFKVPKFTSPIQ